MSLVIRDGAPDDAPIVFALVVALAEYERLAHEVVSSAEDFRRAMAEESVRVLIAEMDGEACGFALYFFNFSTFLGRRGVYLEDLFVTPSRRGGGIGRALLARLAAIAKAEDCARLDWQVLDWNAPAIAFYKGLGAVPLDQWTTFRVAGPALDALARDDG